MRDTDYDEVALARDRWASGARIVTLQEVSAAHHDFLEIMKDTQPCRLVCEGTAAFGSDHTGVYGRVAFDGPNSILRQDDPDWQSVVTCHDRCSCS
jgi:hypothetical protein